MLAADLVVLAHLAFILFVTLGGLAVLRWRRLAWVHLPAAAWGALVELAGWICPLTPLEKRLRSAGGGAVYQGDFVERYILPVVYPAGLTREIQLGLGLFVIVLNAAIYGSLLVRRWRARATRRLIRS